MENNTAPKLNTKINGNVCPVGGEHAALDDFAIDGGRYFLRICYKCSTMFGQPIPNAPPVRVIGTPHSLTVVPGVKPG